MSNDEQQQPAPRSGKVLEALARAERRLFTRPAPKSAKARMKFLRTRAGGLTAAVAERLGTSRRTVERYLAGKLTKPQKRLQAALVEATESEWQPQVRAQARAGGDLQGDDAGGDGVLRIHLHGQLGRWP
ncbi:telomere-protecting terminal protein Tpg [Streptomyces cinereoruber]|uniref:telomere-protecting terminal protein Tpg n=1 Tax=Streptomyces cinereoruber TaxID=67260 RepID=UPI0036365EC0